MELSALAEEHPLTVSALAASKGLTRTSRHMVAAFVHVSPMIFSTTMNPTR